MDRRADALKLLGIAGLWILTGRVLPDLLWRALPEIIVGSLSLPAGTRERSEGRSRRRLFSSARLVSGTVFVPMILHFGNNSLSLGLARGLFRGDSDPLVSVVPNRLLALAALGIFLVVAISVARRASRSQP